MTVGVNGVDAVGVIAAAVGRWELGEEGGEIGESRRAGVAVVEDETVRAGDEDGGEMPPGYCIGDAVGIGAKRARERGWGGAGGDDEETVAAECED